MIAPFRLYTEREKETVKQLVEQELGTWLKSLHANLEKLECDSIERQKFTVKQQDVFMLVSGSGMDASYLRLPRTALEGLARLICETSSFTDEANAEVGILEEVLLHQGEQVLSKITSYPTSLASSFSHDYYDGFGHGRMVFQFPIDTTRAEISLSPSAALTIIKDSQSGSTNEMLDSEIFPMGHALQESKVKVAAKLGGASLTLRDFNEAEVGDVIPLDTKIDEPLRLEIGSGASQLAGYLGEHNGQMCFKVTKEEQLS
ncbi:MAG: FliM/FliN family flagellar motor C-terminal domain-containing protein [Pseudomonadota bacterium]